MSLRISKTQLTVISFCYTCPSNGDRNIIITNSEHLNEVGNSDFLLQVVTLKKYNRSIIYRDWLEESKSVENCVNLMMRAEN